MTENKIHVSPLVLVEEFHLVYGQPIRVIPSLDVPQRELRIKLIREELIEELKEAIDTNDFIEVVDALADTLYVAYGAALTHGIAIDERQRGYTKHVSFAPTLKLALESTGTPFPRTPQFRKEILLEQYTTLVKYFNQLVEASETNRIDDFTLALTHLISRTYETAILSGVDIDEILLEVQRSNLSKLGIDGKPIYNEAGKVIKGPNFSEPKILVALQEQGYIV